MSKKYVSAQDRSAVVAGNSSRDRTHEQAIGEDETHFRVY